MLRKAQDWMNTCCSYVIVAELGIVDLLTALHRKLKLCGTEEMNSLQYTHLGRAVFDIFIKNWFPCPLK